MTNSELEEIFPNLKNTSYQPESPKDIRYNCIAWAAGNNSRWWWPGKPPRYYWPGSSHEESLENFISVFNSFGYKVCNNLEFEEGYKKVAIYVRESRPTHMARQLPSKQWISKCGELEDIIHELEGLEGDLYGNVAVIMKRPLK